MRTINKNLFAIIKERVGRNFLYYLAYQLLRYSFPLIVTPLLARSLGSVEFSSFVIWNSLIWTSSIFIEFGFHIFALNWVAKAESKEEVNSVFSSIVLAKLILAPIAILIFWTLSSIFLHHSDHLLLIYLGVISTLAYSMNFAWLLQGRGYAATAVLVETIPQALQLLVIMSIVKAGSTLTVIALIQCCTAISIFICGVLSVVLLGHSIKLSQAIIVDTFKGASPYFLERFCFTAYSTATPLLIATLSSHNEVAYYSIGDKINSFLTGASIPVTQAILPMISRSLNRGRKTYHIEIISGVCLTTFFAACTVFHFAPNLIVRFVSSSYENAVPVVRIFCFSAVITVAQTLTANLIVIPRGKANTLIWSSSASLAVNFLLQLALVPLFGASGAATARVFSELTTLIILLYILRKA